MRSSGFCRNSFEGAHRPEGLAELLGTGLLVYFGVGVATLSFGPGFAVAGSSFAAGVVITALAFGLILLALAYVLGPISGCHVNPAVTLGVLLSGRIPLIEAVAYWIAQFIGGILGALLLWGAFRQLAAVQQVEGVWGPTAGARRVTSTSTQAAPSWPKSC